MTHVMNKIGQAIFLLAFCAFQVVFTEEIKDNLAGDITASKKASNEEIFQVNFKVSKNIEALTKPLKFKEITPDEILSRCTLTDASEEWDKSFDTKTDKCQQCYLKTKTTEDIQSAENCCKKLTEKLKKDAELYYGQAKTCIAGVAEKCTKSATDCQKEATNVNNAFDKMEEDYKKGKTVKGPNFDKIPPKV